MTKNNLENEIKQDNRKKKKFFNANNSLADFVIPFITGFDSLGRFNELYFKYLVFKHNCSDNVIHTYESQLSNYTYEIKTIVEKTKDLYMRMVKTAFEEKELNIKESEELEEQIMLAMPKITWRCRGETGKRIISKHEPTFEKPTTIEAYDDNTGKTYHLEPLDDNEANNLIGIITSTLVDAFEVSDNKKEAIAYTYFGKCLECGRFFIKTSKNKIFCSNTCSSKKRSRDFRDKKNK